jgi:hypothetical protein
VESRLVHFLIDRAYVLGHEAKEVLSPVYWSCNFTGSIAAYEASLAGFSVPQRRALGVYWYQAEVNNGGHWQFFSNYTGLVYPDALAGLEMLGDAERVAILQEALRRLGGEPSRRHGARNRLIEATGATFDDLDTRFYELDRRRPLLPALTRWIHAHPTDFECEGLLERPWVP